MWFFIFKASPKLSYTWNTRQGWGGEPEELWKSKKPEVEYLSRPLLGGNEEKKDKSTTNLNRPNTVCTYYYSMYVQCDISVIILLLVPRFLACFPMYCIFCYLYCYFELVGLVLHVVFTSSINPYVIYSFFLALFAYFSNNQPSGDGDRTRATWCFSIWDTFF